MSSIIYLDHPQAGEEGEGEGDDDEDVGEEGDETDHEAIVLGGVLLNKTEMGKNSRWAIMGKNVAIVLIDF